MEAINFNNKYKFVSYFISTFFYSPYEHTHRCRWQLRTRCVDFRVHEANIFDSCLFAKSQDFLVILFIFSPETILTLFRATLCRRCISARNFQFQWKHFFLKLARDYGITALPHERDIETKKTIKNVLEWNVLVFVWILIYGTMASDTAHSTPVILMSLSILAATVLCLGIAFMTLTIALIAYLILNKALKQKSDSSLTLVGCRISPSKSNTWYFLDFYSNRKCNFNRFEEIWQQQSVNDRAPSRKPKWNSKGRMDFAFGGANIVLQLGCWQQN